MRMLKVLFALLIIGATVFPALAQDTVLEFGQAVTGEISDREFEFEYSFAGEEGQLISIQMSPADDSELDPEVYLYSSDNELLAANDDFPFPTSLILFRLPAAGEYLIVATRNDGRSGSSSGEFSLEVSLAESTPFGTTIEATYSTDFFSGVSPTYLLAPEADGTVTLTYTQDNSETYAGLRIAAVPDWSVDPEFSFYEDVFWLGNSELSSSGSVTLDLIGGRLYILRVEFGGYGQNSSFNADEGVISITIE